jgi:AcrR family transcriptional regulator
MSDSEKVPKRAPPGRSGRGKPLQDRAVQTQRDLLDAARRVFARDGFELARLEHIARAAGKTRGALYSHFRDKEDLFFALIEQDMARDSEAYLERLTPESTFEERVAVLTDQLESLLRDRRRFLLYLEFKMYAIRHPRRTQRLADLHAKVCREGAARKLDLIPEFHSHSEPERRRRGAAFGSVLDGLALNLYFDPNALTATDIRAKLERLVREQLAIGAEESRV